MKSDKTINYMIVAFILSAIAAIGFWVGVGYIAWHFISKYW